MGKFLRQRSLTVKQIVLTFFVVLVVGGGATIAQSWYSLGVEQAAAKSRIQQLVDSARENAAAAAFRLDEDLADYVTTGLAVAPEVARASIRDESGNLLASMEDAETANAPDWLRNLAFRDLATIDIPLAAPERPQMLVGTLTVEPDSNALTNDFLTLLRSLVFLDAAKAVLLALVFSLLFFNALTRPLLALVASVRRVRPGFNAQLDNVERLRAHEDELGKLVRSFDDQLLMFRQLLEERGALVKDLKLRNAALNAMDSGLLLVDLNQPQLPIVDENAAIAEMLDQPASSFSGRPVADVFDNSGLSHAGPGSSRRFIVSAMQGRAKSSIFEFHGSGKQPRLFSVSTVPVKTGDGEPTHRAIIVSDITKARETEEQLRHAQKMDALGKVAGGIAHDFNNTLAVMKGNIELASRDFAGKSEVMSYLQPIERSVDRATELTRRLLRFSRKAPLQASHEDLHVLIRQMSDMLASSLTPQIAIKLELEADEATVSIDRGDFEDALLNLAVNARDAMPDGGTLTLSTWTETVSEGSKILREGIEPGRFACLRISDTGTGIDPSAQKRLFEPFFTTKDESRGTGLGLSQVYGFVERSGGNIQVTSTPGSGSEFTIYLPLAGESDADTAATGPQPVLRGGDETVLLVDDEPDLLDAAREMLERLGYRVLATTYASEAVRLFEESADEIDLLMSDVVMPGGMDGYELAERLREHRPDIKVLMTTGYDSKRSRRTSDPVLAKPYSAEEMAETVRQVLD